MTDKKVPELRFEGFKNEWEQRKLGEVFQQTVEYIDPKEAGLELWSVTVENGLTPKSERYNREFLVKKNDKFKAIHPDEIVYNPMNMTLGSIGFNNSGKDVAVSGYYVTMKLKKEFDSKYFATWLPSPNAINLYKLYATGSLIERQRVQFPTLSGIRTLMPSLDEQNQIGSFFTSLDDTITLHQRKIDLLKQFKQAYLQKLFPKNGETVPEVRFANFEEEWEQRKLENIAEKVSVGIATSSSEYFTDANNGIPFIKNMNIKESKIDASNLEYITAEFDQMNKNKRLLPGDIITARTGYPGLSAVVPDLLKGAQTFTTLITRLNFLKAVPEYIAVFINAPIGMKQIGGMEAGGAQKNVNAKTLEKLNVSLPSIDEQKKIATFVNRVDDTITLHQSKLDQLKQLKSAFLQKMFI
ncbi:type I restriction endonuclease subunit S [Enterococcus pseudoavium]|nr:type I restriction endonuclease subunit S [Enterococcus pseudoavium]